jgi:hypothetical protein
MSLDFALSLSKHQPDDVKRFPSPCPIHSLGDEGTRLSCAWIRRQLRREWLQSASCISSLDVMRRDDHGVLLREASSERASAASGPCRRCNRTDNPRACPARLLTATRSRSDVRTCPSASCKRRSSCRHHELRAVAIERIDGCDQIVEVVSFDAVRFGFASASVASAADCIHYVRTRVVLDRVNESLRLARSRSVSVFVIHAAADSDRERGRQLAFDIEGRVLK